MTQPNQPQTKYKNAVCRGSYALGTACKNCERCKEQEEILSSRKVYPLETNQEQGPRKFLEYPLVIDWLQWSDEFRQEMGKPDMPQVALTLISEMKGEIRSLQQKVSELEVENKRLREAANSYLKITPVDGWHFSDCILEENEDEGGVVCSCGVAFAEEELRQALKGEEK